MTSRSSLPLRLGCLVAAAIALCLTGCIGNSAPIDQTEMNVAVTLRTPLVGPDGAPVMASQPVMNEAGFPMLDASGDPVMQDQPVFTETLGQAPIVSLHGGPTVKNVATYDLQRFSTTGEGNPWVANFNASYSWVQGYRTFRAVNVQSPLGMITWLGTEDATLEEFLITEDAAGLTTVKLMGLGSLTSTVEEKITAQLAIVMGEAFINSTNAEKDWRVEQVKAQLALGQSLTEAATAVAKLAFPGGAVLP